MRKSGRFPSVGEPSHVERDPFSASSGKVVVTCSLPMNADNTKLVVTPDSSGAEEPRQDDPEGPGRLRLQYRAERSSVQCLRCSGCGEASRRRTAAPDLHQGSILTSMALSPAPCSQNRIGSPARARLRSTESARRKPVVRAGNRPGISSWVTMSSLG